MTAIICIVFKTVLYVIQLCHWVVWAFHSFNRCIFSSEATEWSQDHSSDSCVVHLWDFGGIPTVMSGSFLILSVRSGSTFLLLMFASHRKGDHWTIQCLQSITISIQAPRQGYCLLLLTCHSCFCPDLGSCSHFVHQDLYLQFASESVGEVVLKFSWMVLYNNEIWEQMLGSKIWMYFNAHDLGWPSDSNWLNGWY